MITLRAVTKENWIECIKLSVNESQKAFVATNVFSLAQASVYSSYTPLAIYSDDLMVGFALYGVDPDDNQMGISRLMIDQRHQRKGYGRAALVQLIERIKREASARHAIYLSFEPQNKNAEALYTSLGFAHTGEVEEGELIMKLTY